MLNKLKRITAALLSAAVCASGAVTAAAAGDESKWTIKFTGTDKPQGDTYYAEYTMEAKYDGTYAMNIVYPNAAKEGNYLEIYTTLAEIPANGKYGFKLYMNTAKVDGKFRGCNMESKIEVAGQKFTFENCDVTDKAAEDAPSGEAAWKEYYKEITITDATSKVVKFTFDGPVRGAYLDEVSLYKLADDSKPTGENLITCGGFETVVQGEIIYDPAKYIPADVMALPTSTGGLAISWRNPSSETLKSVSLYDVTTDCELLSDSFATTKGTINSYITGALTAESDYQYKLVFNWDDIPSTEYFIGATAKASSTGHTLRAIGDVNVSLTHNNSDHPYGFFDARLDTKTKTMDGSNTSLHLMSNHTTADGQNGVVGNVAGGMSFPISVEEGKNYQISMDMKTESSPVELYVRFNPGNKSLDKAYQGDDDQRMKNTRGTFDWKTLTATKTAMESGITSLNITWLAMTDGIWIDNLAMYLLDEDGKPTGENLIANGDFEGLISTEVGEIGNVKATGGIGKAALSWKTSGSADSVNIYKKVGEDWEYCGNAAGDIGGIEFTELKYDMDYTFRAVPANADGFEGTAQEVTVTTTAPDYLVYEPVLYCDGAQVSGVTVAGKYTVKTSVKNNAYTDGMAYEMIVALFKDGELCEVTSEAETIPCAPANSNPKQVKSPGINVPSGDGYSIRVYHINSRSDWSVLTPHKVFN